MQKIISLFQRNYDGDRLVRDEIVPGAEWVVVGEGTATRKFDGTCCMVRGGRLFKRYEVRPGRKPPEGFEAAAELDKNTGKRQGWLPVGDGPGDKYHREAFERYSYVLVRGEQPDRTYELCGPKVQGNPEGLDRHVLVPHGRVVIPDAPRTFEELREWFRGRDIEGIVWHRPDGKMVKIKGRDFGLRRPMRDKPKTWVVSSKELETEGGYYFRITDKGELVFAHTVRPDEKATEIIAQLDALVQTYGRDSQAADKAQEALERLLEFWDVRQGAAIAALARYLQYRVERFSECAHCGADLPQEAIETEVGRFCSARCAELEEL